ncbi:cytochrome b-c1 complex subunit 6, mitochondrial-like [Teleopsis dalmanni]|uniref:cytochrome b-c1 complex subunit 6, mitochondrial-like n=1 Tax=Teleopsis dalmanni TaxID=139649 RepID=UPI0018CD62CE|nr:cytochrome b-c1 complex subunit 6, mitochondrial-like [Teleopsis dalmanni]
MQWHISYCRIVGERKFMMLPEFLKGVFSVPVLRAEEETAEEEELVDPQTSLREKCATHGNTESLYNKYQECNDRVNSKSKTTETCMEELFDYVAELDHCVAHSLFAKLK